LIIDRLKAVPRTSKKAIEQSKATKAFFFEKKNLCGFFCFLRPMDPRQGRLSCNALSLL
jgi:hypothetical protein